MRHRHNTGPVKYRTKRGNIRLRKRPMHRFTIVGRNPILHKQYRKLFQDMDKAPFEVGGYLDMDKRGLEKADVYMGREGFVDIDITLDKELDFHTHNASGDKYTDKLNYFPSPGDLQASAEFPSQAMLIFHEGTVTLIKKNKDFSPNPQIISQIEYKLRKDARTMPINKLFEKFKPEYKRLGLDMELIGRNKDILLPIEVIEPVR